MTKERIARLRKDSLGNLSWITLQKDLTECLDEIETLTRERDCAVQIKEAEKRILLKEIEQHARCKRTISKLEAQIKDMQDEQPR